MPDYQTASRTKDRFHLELLRDHPEITSIAPRLELDDQGNPTGEGVIVIGVKATPPIRVGRGPSSLASRQHIPDRLPAIDAYGNFLAGQQVAVIVETMGDVELVMNVTRNRPCDGGFSVGHTSITAGTFGGNVRVGANFGFILSNNHVLAAMNVGAVGDPIVQPGPSDGGMAPRDTIARLTRFVPVQLDTAQSPAANQADVAVAESLNPTDITRNVKDIGVPASTGIGIVQQSVRKSGRTTQLTFGRITSDNATYRVSWAGGTATFVNQLEFTQMVDSGDSGSLVFDRDSLTVVGLIAAKNSANSYGSKILTALALISQAFTVYRADGTTTNFDATEVSLIDA